MSPSDLIKLEAVSREDTGKQAAKRLRAEGLTPGVIYGLEMGTKSISIPVTNLAKALQGGGLEALMEIVVDGGKGEPVMIFEVQREPVTQGILHVDFKRLDLLKTGEFMVRLEFVGEADGIREGGRLNIIEETVIVECLPTEIPAKLEADITGLAIGEGVYARDLKVPEGIALKLEPNSMVANIAAPVAEEVVEEVPVEGEEVPVEGEEVPGEEGAEEKPEGEAPAGEKKE